MLATRQCLYLERSLLEFKIERIHFRKKNYVTEEVAKSAVKLIHGDRELVQIQIETLARQKISP